MSTALDYLPLRRFARVYRSAIWYKRILMILRRLLIAIPLLLLLGWLIFITVRVYTMSNAEFQAKMQSTESISYTYNFDSGGSLDLSVLLFFLVVLPSVFAIILSLTMMAFWQYFARINKFEYTNSKQASDAVRVPSFSGKLLSSNLGVISGCYGPLTFSLLTWQYKEGGILRWRERKMDSILMLKLPIVVPHIVVNARKNEKARLSNMTVRMPSENKFQFEGMHGQHYDVYASSVDRVAALQLFTPDVLGVLYTLLPTTDIELMGDRLWLVQRYQILDDVAAKNLFEAAEKFYNEIEHQFNHMASTTSTALAVPNN